MKKFPPCNLMHRTAGSRNAGSSLGFQNCGCRFSYFLKTPKIKCTFVQKLRVKNQISSKSLGAKSVLLKICECSCTHCTHINKGPERRAPSVFKTWLHPCNALQQLQKHTTCYSHIWHIKFQKKICSPSSISFRVRLALPLVALMTTFVKPMPWSKSL